MDYGLIGVLGGAAFACAVVVHLWVASCREARRVERRVAGLRDEYREEREVLTLSLERTLNGCQHVDCQDQDRKLMEHMKVKIAEED